MLNVSPLNSIYGNDIPADIQDALKTLEEHLQKQKNCVREVTILPNCSIDYDRTMHLQKKTLSKDIKWVLQGVLVTVSPEYRLSYADAMWFHPEMAKGRSVFSIDKTVSKEDLNKINEIHHIDDSYPKEDPTFMSPFIVMLGITQALL